MQALRQDTSNRITALYDGQCPICRYGATHYKLHAEEAGLDLIDMREASALKTEAIGQGYDLDKGVVIKQGDQLYYAGDAIHFMALHVDRTRWINRLIHRIFRSKSRSRFLYPLLSTTRLFLLRLRRIPKIHEADAERQESSIKKLLGDDWSKLHPNVQRRFVGDPKLAEHIFYRGSMETVECSLAGKLFAHLTRLIANPLTPYEGKNVRMDVILYRKAGLAGVYWRRTYYYEGRTPYTVTSVKRQDSKGRLTECVGAGFGMELDLAVKNGGLHFRGTRYFWQVGKLRLPLPHWLSPGETNVLHDDLGDGSFRFTISMDHIFLGRTFYQTGVFWEE